MRFSPFRKRDTRQNRTLDRARQDSPREQNLNEAFQDMLLQIVRL